MKIIKVKKKHAESIRKKLIAENNLDNNYLPLAEGNYVYFAVKRSDGYDLSKKELKKRTVETNNLRSLLKEKIDKKYHESLPSGFEVIGDIAIIEVPEELNKFEKVIGKTLLSLHKNIKVVVKKAGHFEGQFRTRKVKVIAGEDRKETIHKENNCRIKLNPETCYFSPRLSTERRRIIDLVRDNETILVMFSGVGPYPITIAKNTGAKEIIGIEINPEAHRYAEENLKLNKVKDVSLYLGDVREIVPKLNKKFDRILMPLPKTAEEFLDVALLVSKKGTIIHMYDFLHEKDIPNLVIKKIKEKIPKAKIINVVKCGQYSPGKFRVCADFEI
jgi:tRNA (guanine37-N1)-methyltransferase